MVFIALPALQRSQRDAQRKELANSIMTKIISFQAHNNGNLPKISNSESSSSSTSSRCRYKKGVEKGSQGIFCTGTWYDFFEESFDEGELIDPDGLPWGFFIQRAFGASWMWWYQVDKYTEKQAAKGYYHGIAIAVGGMICDSDNSEKGIKWGGLNRPNTFAIIVGLEGGGLYCVDNT